VIDINMRCPARRVTGIIWLHADADLDHAVSLIDATVKAASDSDAQDAARWDDRTKNAPELARRAQEAGIALVTVHAARGVNSIRAAPIKRCAKPGQCLHSGGRERDIGTGGKRSALAASGADAVWSAARPAVAAG
jgi:hypothetical protein